MGSPEIVEARDEPKRRKGHRGGDREHSGRARSEPARDVAQQAQHLARSLVERLTLLGKAQVAVVPAKQGHAELLLEGLDLAADSRLGDVELHRGLGEAQVARRRLEALQQVEGRQAAPLFKHSFFSCNTCPKIV